MRRKCSSAERLARLFELYEQGMYRTAYAILHDEGQAEDAVMAAFEGIVRSGRIPQKPASQEAERLAIAAVRNAAIDQYRRNKRERRPAKLFSDGAVADMPSPLGNPERDALDRAGFEELIGPLGQAQKEFLGERFGKGASVKETAQKLGISEACVRKRQQRAVAALRTMKGLDNG